MIIATAGHVDHGKTTLLQAITGVNAHHLPEEKRRGMTIDLGYAYWPQADGRILGFIDVPGHEKFLANMLAGIGGIDHALLVVACDDGVMAQTREHLTLLRLSGLPQLSVVLTKADKVDDARVQQVREQVLVELAQQGYTLESLWVTAANTGQGIDALRQHLQQLSPAATNTRHRFRLAIDRVFSVKGAGLVVTGTALAGPVAIGDTLWLTGADCPVRVRGLHAQNQTVEQAWGGQRIALNLGGHIDKQQITRGDWLLAQQPAMMVDRVLVELEGVAPLHHWQPLHLHHAASHLTGRLSLLNPSARPPLLAELRLDRPLWLAEDDRLILRDISARQTLGAARVLSLSVPGRGKRQPTFLAMLTALAHAQSDAEVFTLRLQQGPLSVRHFAWARQLNDAAMSALLTSTDLILVGDSALATTQTAEAQQRLLHELAGYHQQHGDQLGVGRARLRRMALPTLDEALVFNLIDSLLAQGLLRNTHGWLHLPDHARHLTAEEQTLWQQAQACFTDQALWVRDIATTLHISETETRALLRKAAQLGYVVAIVTDRYYLSEQIGHFADLIRQLDQRQGYTNAADFRDHLGIGRKLAIQILEFFDRSGFTRRKGNDHLLRDRGLFQRDTSQEIRCLTGIAL